MTWIKLTNSSHRFGNKKILINADNIACVMTGQGEGYEGMTIVFFPGDNNFVVVDESVDEVEKIIVDAVRF